MSYLRWLKEISEYSEFKVLNINHTSTLPSRNAPKHVTQYFGTDPVFSLPTSLVTFENMYYQARKLTSAIKGKVEIDDFFKFQIFLLGASTTPQ